MEDIKTVPEITGKREIYLTRRWNLPSRNTNFTGRDHLLKQILDKLSRDKPLVITACHGLGGVGKTQLVTEFAYRNQKKYERIIWIPSESADQIETAYLSLGQDLGIILEKTSPAEAIHIAKTWLSNHPKNLIIFDNAENYESVQNYVLPTGADILITSRNTEWTGGIGVDVFSLEEAVLYFRKIVGEREDDTKEKIEELAEELGRLPLALAQATAYIRQNKISIQYYLDLYRAKKAYFLSQSVLPDGDQHVPVYVTWNITMERIKQESELAPKLLNVCSYLHSEKIPALLLHTFCEDESFNPNKIELFEEARGRLKNYSMVTVDESDNSVSVHRLIQAVLQLNLCEPVKKEYIKKIVKVFRLTFPYDVPFTNFRNRGYLVNHLEVLSQQFAWLSLSEEDKSSQFNLIVLLSDAYGDLGQHYQKKLMLEKTLLEHPVIGGQPFIHFYLLWRAVQDDKNINNHVEKLISGLMTLSPTLKKQAQFFMDVLYNFAALYGNLGKHIKKVTLLSALLKIKKTVFLDESELPIKEMSSLGRALGELAKYHESEKILSEALTLCRNEPQTARVLLVLGTVLALQPSRYSDAQSYLMRAITYSKTLYGEGHDEEARALNHLGYVCACLGDVEKGMQYLNQALDVHERNNNQAEIIKVRINKGYVYGLMSNYEAQKTEMQDVLSQLSKLSYDKPKFKADALVNLANAFYHLGELHNAYANLYESYNVISHDSNYGPAHPVTKDIGMKLEGYNLHPGLMFFRGQAKKKLVVTGSVSSFQLTRLE